MEASDIARAVVLFIHALHLHAGASGFRQYAGELNRVNIAVYSMDLSGL